MTIHLDGIGDDWVVTRRPGGKPELSVYASLPELRRVLQRALVKAQMQDAGPQMQDAGPVPAVQAPTPRNGVSADPVLPNFPSFDCKACGACCAPKTDQKFHARLSSGERSTVGRLLPIIRRADGDFIQTKRVGGSLVCAALEGEIGKDCRCSVYESRPLICQLFEVGGAECLLEREALLAKGVKSATAIE